MAQATQTWPTPWRFGRIPQRSLALLLLGALIIGGGVWAYQYGPFAQRAPTVTYQTSGVQPGDLRVTVTATGPITSPSTLPLTFKNSGKLVEIDVAVGDKVQAGQILAKLDTTDLEQQVAQAQASVAQAGANYAKLAAGPTTEAIGVARAQLNAAQA